MMRLMLFFSAHTAWNGDIILEALDEANWQPGWFLVSYAFIKNIYHYKMLIFYKFGIVV